MFLPFLRDYVRILPHITTMMHSAYTAGWPVYMMFTFVWQRRWGGLLCGVAALLAVVFLALLGYYIYDRHAARKARAQRDIEKALVQQVRPQAASTAHPANLSSMQDKLDKTMAQTASHAGVCNLLFTLKMWLCALQAGGGTGGSKADLYTPSPVTPAVSRGLILDPKLGYSGSLLSESHDGADSSFEDGTALSAHSRTDHILTQ